MAQQWHRLLMAAAAAGMALLGSGSLFLGGSSGSAAVGGPYIVEISESGFNPSLCQLSRGDRVAWKNIGTRVHRVVFPNAGVESEPQFDTGDIAPGETSTAAGFEIGGRFRYEDQYNPSLTGMVQTPQYSNNWAASCLPLPPTPTPTPTPSVTPTAVPTPSPAPIVAAACKFSPGCAVAGDLARDEE